MTEQTVGVSISWVKGHRRSREIASVFEVRPYFVRAKSRFLALRYLKQHVRTRSILRTERPNLIVVMQPPPVALLSVTSYARKHRAVVVGDLHTGAFLGRKWSWTTPWVMRTLRKYGGAVVPNKDLAELCQAAGVEVFVSHGWISPLEDEGQILPDGLARDTTYVLVPFTYRSDEPVDEVLEAARMCPDITWVLTSRAPESVTRRAPSNVLFTGFVSDGEFQALQLHARAVLALTTQPSTMQSAGYEAVAAATPLITVRERVLVDYFGDHAIYTTIDARGIADAVRRVALENDVWRARMATLRNSVMGGQGQVADEIRAWIRRKADS